MKRVDRVFAELVNFGRQVNVSLLHESPEGESYAKAVEWIALDPSGAFVEPMLSMPPAGAQLLMDELWRIGFRPSEGTGSAGSLAATERHLKDMREIAFGVMRQSKVIE